MHLLSVQALQGFLNKEFKDIDPEIIEDLLLRSNNISISQVNDVIKELQLNELPNDFVFLITHYDFSNLTIGIIQFGYDDDNSLHWLIKKNDPTKYGHEDWLSELRNNNLICIGGGDPFTVILDIHTGHVYATTVEMSLSERIKIADTFTHFIEGLGTAFIAKRKKMNQTFLELAETEFGKEALIFWKYCI